MPGDGPYHGKGIGEAVGELYQTTHRDWCRVCLGLGVRKEVTFETRGDGRLVAVDPDGKPHEHQEGA